MSWIVYIEILDLSHLISGVNKYSYVAELDAIH